MLGTTGPLLANVIVGTLVTLGTSHIGTGRGK